MNLPTDTEALTPSEEEAGKTSVGFTVWSVAVGLGAAEGDWLLLTDPSRATDEGWLLPGESTREPVAIGRVASIWFELAPGASEGEGVTMAVMDVDECTGNRKAKEKKNYKF